MNNHPQQTDTVHLDGVVLTFADVNGVVANFYAEVAVDSMLKVPFGSVSDWPHHVERLTHFWWRVLGGTPYLNVTYNPIVKHFEAGFNVDFLSRWLGLFEEVMNRTLTPKQTAAWIALASQMGNALSMKNEMYKEMVQREAGA